MNPNEILQILSINTPKNFNTFIEYAKKGKVPEHELIAGQCTPVHCTILILEILCEGLKRNKKSTKKLIYEAFKEEAKIMQIKELREYIKKHFLLIEQKFFLSFGDQ